MLLRSKPYKATRLLFRSFSVQHESVGAFLRSKQFTWPEENLASTVDEKGGFYPVRLGESFDNGRFVVTRKLGWGRFSNVWLARDRNENRHVALKVLSAHASRAVEAGNLAERDVLESVTSASSSHPGSQNVLRLYMNSHSTALLHIRNMQDPKRLPLSVVLHLTRDVLKGLQYLHDECKVIHSDLQPNNILFGLSNMNQIIMRELAEMPCPIYDLPKMIPPSEFPAVPVVSTPLNPESLGPLTEESGFRWVIADLGHAQLQHNRLSNVVQPYALRAPEVVLGLEWGTPIDIWNLGCLMYELATGHWLFSPEATNEMSLEMVHLAQMAQRTGQDHDETALMQYANRHNLQGLKEKLSRHIAGSNTAKDFFESTINESSVTSAVPEEIPAFIRLMKSLLVLDPTKRPCAVEVLRDPVFADFD